MFGKYIVSKEKSAFIRRGRDESFADRFTTTYVKLYNQKFLERQASSVRKGHRDDCRYLFVKLNYLFVKFLVRRRAGRGKGEDSESFTSYCQPLADGNWVMKNASTFALTSYNLHK